MTVRQVGALGYDWHTKDETIVNSIAAADLTLDVYDTLDTAGDVLRARA
jgi:hypothetical protein